MGSEFQLLMISAMYENGGNTTQRLLDGHPELQSYPYESQLGTKHVADHLSSLYPLKYRWPVFPLHGTPEQDYEIPWQNSRTRTLLGYCGANSVGCVFYGFVARLMDSRC